MLTPDEIQAGITMYIVTPSLTPPQELLRFAKYIERAALERAADAIRNKRLTDATFEQGDLAYNRAVHDCEEAVRALTDWEPTC